MRTLPPGWRSACHPDVYADIPDRFWRNDGSGAFRDETAAAGLAGGAGDGDVARLQRFPQHLQHPAVELREFVQEHNPVVGEGDLPGARIAAAADQGHR